MSDADEGHAELRGTRRIEVRCLSCGRLGLIEEACGPVDATPLVQLTKRLRCSECGSRAVKAKTVRTPRDLARLVRRRMDEPRG